MTDSTAELRIKRRAMLGIAASGVIASVTACGGAKHGATSTATVAPSVTPLPTPTQGVIASPVPGYADPDKWQGRSLTIAALGGDYQKAQEQAFFNPFAAATGASIQIKTADTDRMKSQVDQQSVTWDLLTFPSDEVITLGRANYLEPIDYAVVDKTPLADEAVLQYGVGADFWSTILVYPPAIARAPQSWKDFWNVNPPVSGEPADPAMLRALRHSPVGTLEFALLADGVDLGQIYPIDLDRAFASLDRIKPNIAVWYEDGKLPVEMVVNGQVGMASAWNVRPWQLNVTGQVGIEWYGGMLSADSWVVPRGAPNKDIAMDFVNFATRAVPSANFARLAPYGPVNKDALTLLRADRAALLPTSPASRAVQFFQNWTWWADNVDAVTARFEDWLLAPATASGTPTVAASPSK